MAPRTDTPDFEVVQQSQPSGVSRTTVIRTVSIVVVMIAWEVFGRQVNPLFMSYPSAILAAAVELTRSGELPSAMLESLKTLVLGFAGASLFGIVGGLLIGRYREVNAALDWLVSALYSTPLVALIPLVILWLGLGFPAKLFVVFILSVFPILINTSAGVQNVSQSLVDVAVAFRANQAQIFAKIIVPAALPYIMAGLRLGIGRAIIGMVTAEFFTAVSGLGGIVVKYGNRFRTDDMLVPVIVLMAMGVLLTTLVREAETRFAPWKETERAQ
jgi:NitT/TauT family transport system permease protein